MRKRVLFVRHWAYGDILLSIPVVREYAKSHPDTEIHFYTWVPEALSGIPYIDRVIDAHVIGLSKIEKNYDEVFMLQYEAHRQLSIIDGYGISTGITSKNHALEVAIQEPFLSIAKRLVGNRSGRSALVGIQPLSGSVFKNYPLERSRILVRRIKENHPGTEVVVLCDRNLGFEGCLDLSGQIPDLRIVNAIVSLCSSFISVDAGLLHVAQALKVPTVGIFGATRAELIATDSSRLIVVENRKLECLGCYHSVRSGEEAAWSCRRGDIACMNGISVEAVYAAFLDLQRLPISDSLAVRVAEYKKFHDDYCLKVDIPEEKRRLSELYRRQIGRIARRSRFSAVLRALLKRTSVLLLGPQMGPLALRQIMHCGSKGAYPCSLVEGH